MRILILNWRDIKHPLAGGAEISTHQHAKRWLEEGHEVILFSSKVPGEPKKETLEGIKIIRAGNHYTVHLHAFFYYLRNLRGKIDVMVDEFHFIPFFTPLYTRTRIIAFIHETAEEIWFKNQFFPVNVLGFLLEPFFFKLYKNIPFITVSDSTKKDLIRFGIKEKNIYIIHNGASFEKSKSKKEKDPTIIFLGRLAKDKGVEDAVVAFSDIQKKIKEAKLWIVGREEKKGYIEDLKKKINNLKIERKVSFLGFVDDKKKFNLLKKAWILIHPSYREGWGLTVIEAAYCGTPCVAYDVPGLCDSVLDKKTGILVNKKDPVMLAKKIIEIIYDKSLYSSLSKNAISWSKSFNWKDATDKSLNIIQDIK